MRHHTISFVAWSRGSFSAFSRVAKVAYVVCGALLLLLTASVVPLSASDASGHTLGNQAMRTRLIPSMQAQVVDLAEICTSLETARSSDFAPTDAAAVMKASVDFPTPAAVDTALTALSDSSTNASSRALAVRATNRFFGGVCNAGGNPQNTACTLFVTLRVAQNIQVQSLSSQISFALHNTDMSTEFGDAIVVLSQPESESEPDAYDAAVSVVMADMINLCDNLDANSVATESAPEALPATGLSGMGVQLLFAALGAVAAGAMLLGACEQRLARISRR